MAPRLRSSMHGRKAFEEPEQPNSIDIEDEDEDMESDHDMVSSELEDDMLEDVNAELDESPLRTSAQELLRPLQETADRVGRQVEEFSQALDRFRSKKSLTGQQLWQETWILLDQYADIARTSADRVKTTSDVERKAQKNRKSLGDTTAQKQNLHLEERLWTLTAQLLPLKSPEMLQDAEYKQNTALVELHQYSTDSQLWKAFLDVDTIANQYELLLEWLQDWKRDTSPELKDTDLEMYDHAHRGEGLSNSGNFFTQGPIKRQKVTRAHPGPLQPGPDVRRVHVRKDDGATLVTQMDPDAAQRQDSNLEKEDEALETSAWQACWELLRRGASPEECHLWWQDRGELWRVLVMRNPGVQVDPVINKSWLRVVHLASNRAYANLCRELGEKAYPRTKYENAVYGIIGGSYGAASPVCKTIDDHLFSLINELLIERYEQFLFAYRQKVQEPDPPSYFPKSSTIGEISKYIQASQTDKSTKAEAHQPHKYLEGTIIADDFANFLLEMGHAAAQMAHLTGQNRFLFDNDDTQVSECAQVAAQDEDLVRITIHLQLALQQLGLLDDAYESNAAIMENNVVNYIGLLERHAKYSLLPLYASKLSAEQQPRVLGRILSKVTQPKERDLQMRLMKQYNIPVYRVIYTICDYTRQTWAKKLNNQAQLLEIAKVIEYKETIVRVRAGFIGEMVDEDEAHLVQSHEWVNCIDAKNWGMAVWLMTALYKILLLSGKLAAAKALSTRIELASTSLKVTGMNLSLAAMVQDSGDDNGDTEMDGEAAVKVGPRSASPIKRRKESKSDHPLARETTNRQKLADQSLVWAHLEHLVQAMDALELWQDLADQVDSVPRDNLSAMKAAKKQLTQALQAVQTSMQPLLEQDFLNYPNDEQEDHDLTQIRNHYLPECILAYNSALYFGGHAITRQHLVQCMELAQQVAQNDSLTAAFVASKRMQELVTAFALDSQALLRANEHNSSTRGRVGKRTSFGGERGGRADIWQVQWRPDRSP